jgi:hypothetical protein
MAAVEEAPNPPIMRWFDHADLPPEQAEVGEWFDELAARITGGLPNGAERATALRNLLHARDAALRAAQERY